MNRTTTSHPVALLGWLAVLGAAVAAGEWAVGQGVPLATMLQDPATVGGAVDERAGMLAVLGSMVLAAAAVVLVGAWADRRRAAGDPAVGGALLAAGVVVALGGLDDAFLLHDHWLAREGVSRSASLGALAGSAVVVAVLHRRVLLRTDVALLVLAAAGAAAPVLVDVPGVSEDAEGLARSWAILLVGAWAWRSARAAARGDLDTAGVPVPSVAEDAVERGSAAAGLVAGAADAPGLVDGAAGDPDPAFLRPRHLRPGRDGTLDAEPGRPLPPIPAAARTGRGDTIGRRPTLEGTKVIPHPAP